MQIEPAPFRIRKIKGKRVELLFAAEPDETVLARLNIGLENTFVLATRNGRTPVGRNHEIIIGSVRVRVRNLGLKNQLRAETCCALLKNLQQFDSADSAKTVAAGSYLLPFEKNVDVVPVAKGASDLRVGFRVDVFEPVHGLVGEDDAPAKSVVGPIAFDDRDVPGRAGLLGEN